jgi:hypothetical protein
VIDQSVQSKLRTIKMEVPDCAELKELDGLRVCEDVSPSFSPSNNAVLIIVVVMSQRSSLGVLCIRWAPGVNAA